MIRRKIIQDASYRVLTILLRVWFDILSLDKNIMEIINIISNRFKIVNSLQTIKLNYII